MTIMAMVTLLLIPSKLMRLGSPNRIDDDSDSKAVDFDRRITSIEIRNDDRDFDSKLIYFWL